MLNKDFRKKKMFRFLVTAFLMGTLTCSQLQPTLAINEKKTFAEEEEKTILDTIVVEKAVSLSEIELPKSEYGKLTWEHPDYVPESQEEDCEVVLKPHEDIDVSWMKGWDAKKEVVHAYITVCVECSVEEEDTTEYTFEVNEETTNDQNGEETVTSDNIEDTDTVSDEHLDFGTEEAEDITDDSEDADGDDSDEVTDLDAVPNDILTSDEDTTEDLQEEDEELDADMDMDEELDADDSLEENDDFHTDVEEGQAPDEDTESGEESGSDKIETIFDRVEIAEDTRPEYADESLNEEERQAVAAQNHNCEGITIYGENLPWYVQFRVYDGQEYQFSNQNGAELFRAYEFQLWDTLNEQEYEVPEGEYITIRMTVPTGYRYTVEHIVASGGRESIYPTIDGNTLVFSTHSFSPFGIAGSVVLVGGDILEGNYTKPSTTPTPTPTPGTTNKGDASTQKPTANPTQKPAQGSGNVTGNAGGNQNSNSTSESGNASGTVSGNTSETGTGSANQGSYTGNTGSSANNTNQNSTSNNSNQTGTQNQNHLNPNTGDNSPIALFAGITAAALLLIVGAVIFLRRKK